MLFKKEQKIPLYLQKKRKNKDEKKTKRIFSFFNVLAIKISKKNHFHTKFVAILPSHTLEKIEK